MIIILKNISLMAENINDNYIAVLIIHKTIMNFK